MYGSSDAAIRELIQNAWDAIQWRKKYGDGHGGRIEIRFTADSGWFEVADDGFGMDQDAVEKSFLDIGQDKFEILGQADRASQIGFFGIGVLSIFLIADRFEVTTRRLNSREKPICFEVTGIENDIAFRTSEENLYGTRIRVYPRPGGTFSLHDIPKVVQKYARHVAGIYTHAINDSTMVPVDETWSTSEGDFHGVGDVTGVKGLRAGRLGFTSALKQQAGTLSSDITICNAGFLAETGVHDLVAEPNLGLCGEIDVTPHTLTMAMSRERMQRDDLWEQLGSRLQRWGIDAAIGELRAGSLSPKPDALDSFETKRNLFLWYHFVPPSPPFSELYELIDKRLFETAPFRLAEGEIVSLSRILRRETRGAKLFFKKIWHAQEQVQDIDDEGMPFRVSQEIRDSVRVGALRAKGYEVIELDRLQVNLRNGGTVQTHRIDEYPLLVKCLQRRGVQLIDIANASDSDMDLGDIEKLPILKDALLIAGGLRFARVPDSKRRVITDRSGIKYINLKNADVQNLLKVIPDAVSNPLKQMLLEAYLKIEDFKFRDARQILVELLRADNLEALAGIDVAPLTRDLIAAEIKELLVELKQ